MEAYGSQFYLNHLHPTDAQWVDISAGIEGDAEKELMLGGDIAMWTPQVIELSFRHGSTGLPCACPPNNVAKARFFFLITLHLYARIP